MSEKALNSTSFAAMKLRASRGHRGPRGAVTAVRGRRGRSSEMEPWSSVAAFSEASMVEVACGSVAVWGMPWA